MTDTQTHTIGDGMDGMAAHGITITKKGPGVVIAVVNSVTIVVGTIAAAIISLPVAAIGGVVWALKSMSRRNLEPGDLTPAFVLLPYIAVTWGAELFRLIPENEGLVWNWGEETRNKSNKSGSK